MKPRKVLHCQMQKALFVPGYGELRQRTINQQFNPGAVMELHPLGVSITFSTGLQWIAPSAIIECIVLEPPDVKKD